MFDYTHFEALGHLSLLPLSCPRSSRSSCGREVLRREKRLSISLIWQRLILSQARFFPLPSRVFVLIRLLAFVRR
jgi:hypothetical protein